MRRWVAACVILLFTGGICAAEGPALKTEKDKVSYVIGMTVARGMMNDGIELNSDTFMKGFKDGLTGAKSAVADKDAQAMLEKVNKEVAGRRQAQIAQLASDNKKQEETFMAENGKKAGVKTLPSGLQYKVLKEGTGSKPTLYDTVTVNYRGTLLNGNEFDSSYKRKEPATFPVNGVIPGWSEALQMMKTGSKWQVFIPSRLAYGETGGRGIIPPSAALIFEVELLSVNQNPPQAKAAPGKAQPVAKAGK